MTVRLTLNLVDAAQQVQLASRTLDLASGEQTAVQDKVVGALTGLLALELQPDQQRALAAGGSRVPGAYEAFVQGRGYLQRFDRGLDNVDRAITAFTRAVAADSRYTLAETALGEAFWRKHELTKEPDWIARAVEHCERALAVDPPAAGTRDARPDRTRPRTLRRGARGVAARHRARSRPTPMATGSWPGRMRRSTASPTRKPPTVPPSRLGPTIGSSTTGSAASCSRAGSHGRSGGGVPSASHELTPDNTRGYNNLGARASRDGAGKGRGRARMGERSLSIRPTPAAASNLGTMSFRAAAAMPMRRGRSNAPHRV